MPLRNATFSEKNSSGIFVSASRLHNDGDGERASSVKSPAFSPLTISRERLRSPPFREPLRPPVIQEPLRPPVFGKPSGVPSNSDRPSSRTPLTSVPPHVNFGPSISQRQVHQARLSSQAPPILPQITPPPRIHSSTAPQPVIPREPLCSPEFRERWRPPVFGAPSRSPSNSNRLPTQTLLNSLPDHMEFHPSFEQRQVYQRRLPLQIHSTSPDIALPPRIYSSPTPQYSSLKPQMYSPPTPKTYPTFRQQTHINPTSHMHSNSVSAPEYPESRRLPLPHGFLPPRCLSSESPWIHPSSSSATCSCLAETHLSQVTEPRIWQRTDERFPEARETPPSSKSSPFGYTSSSSSKHQPTFTSDRNFSQIPSEAPSQVAQSMQSKNRVEAVNLMMDCKQLLEWQEKGVQEIAVKYNVPVERVKGLINIRVNQDYTPKNTSNRKRKTKDTTEKVKEEERGKGKEREKQQGNRPLAIVVDEDEGSRNIQPVNDTLRPTKRQRQT
ncbi:hypothetical protein K435DRAFT_864264 [Dendrothele bispora CBS 962.96]|uniref:Uncharacterized protein n=1 Tax=Dendrothele bispora (strain CBS 962.96) TaxID=1314807 RepID=A0A4S8LMK2_DENBC|nr:hypothetical protein K435DRAFT_864264 [Dendrothele bispora CBS 962.96]